MGKEGFLFNFEESSDQMYFQGSTTGLQQPLGLSFCGLILNDAPVYL